MHQLPHPQRFFNRLLLRWALVFVVIFPLSFPFEHGGILPDTGAYTQFLFGNLARFTGDLLLGEGNYSAQLASDTAGFYLNFLHVFLFAGILAFVWAKWFSKESSEEKWQYRLVAFIRYYLAWQMLWYGFDKVFKTQFYLPEPNTLFTPMGYLHKDILYWSAMGSSYTYTVFAGLTEILAAVLLLFHRTYVLGILVTAGIMINVLMINIGFDISVKLYSCFLLLLCFIVITVHAPGLYRFFIQQVPASVKTWRPEKRKLYFPIKILVVLLILADALMPFIRTGNYNDDVFERPYLHGAYQVNTYEVNNQTVAPDLHNGNRWKRFFIHRRGYFIVQFMNDDMADFKMQNDTTNHVFLITTYDSSTFRFHYNEHLNSLSLEGIDKNDTIRVSAQKLNLKKLPLLNPEFGWTINE